MIYLAAFILAFTFLQLSVALINLVLREKPRKGTLKSEPVVSVMIPARNEEQNIGNIIRDLLQQDHRNIEVIVFDDISEDRTGSIVEQHMKEDTRIRLVHSTGLPEGWLGKNNACHTMAQSAGGKYFLFVDADVRIKGSIIRDMISMAQDEDLRLISIFPRQDILSTGEKITVPVMNYILLTLLPLILVRKSSFSSLSAANGQFMFFDAAVYREVQPHEKMRAEKVEDIKIARLFKRKRLKVACLTGDDTIRCRMYTGFREAADGFSKNVGEFFGNSLLVATLFWIITTFGILPVLFVPGKWIVLYIAAYLFTRMAVSAASEQNIGSNLVYFFPQQMAMGIFILRAFINRQKGSFTWKGRNIG